MEAAQKKLKKKAKQQVEAKIIEGNEEEAVEIVYSDTDSDCIVVAAARSS